MSTLAPLFRLSGVVSHSHTSGPAIDGGDLNLITTDFCNETVLVKVTTSGSLRHALDTHLWVSKYGDKHG
jgi:hypothetical protein